MSKKNKLNTLYKRFYDWLTDSKNYADMSEGSDVNDFCIFGISEVDPKIPEKRGIYVKTFENIAIGIIQSSSSNNDFLDVYEYTRYQIKSVERIFRVKLGFKDKRVVDLCNKLFEIQDLDKDGKLGIEDLTVALVYLDLQDGILNGKIKYEDAITFGYKLDFESGMSEMEEELKKLKELLYLS